MVKPTNDNPDAGRDNSNNPIRFKDVILATSLIILASLAGISLFVFIIIMVNQSDAIQDFFRTNPEGAEISNRAIGVGFALAGAFASTVIAFAALTAQSTANRSQQKLQAIEEQRIADVAARERIEARKRDLQRHADLTTAINLVVNDAYTIVEDLLEWTTQVFSQLSDDTMGRAGSETQKIEQELGAQLTALMKRHAKTIATRNAAFWAAVDSIRLVEQRDLALDELWCALYDEKLKSQLRDLAETTGFFSAKADSAAILPSGLHHRIFTMHPERAFKVMTVFSFAATEVVNHEVDRESTSVLLSGGKALEDKYRRFKESFEPFFDLEIMRGDFENRIGEFSDRLEEMASRLSEAKEEAESEANDIDSSEEFQVARAAVHGILSTAKKAQQDLRGLTDELADIKNSVAEFAHDYTDLASEHGERFEAALTRIRGLLDDAAPTVRTNLMVRRHSPEQSKGADVDLLKFVIGAIVVPDGALVAVGGTLEQDDVPQPVWSANPGLAFLRDLTRLYLPEDGKEADAASFDLESVSSVFNMNASQLWSSGAAEDTVLKDAIHREAELSAPINVVFDPIWTMLFNSLTDVDFLWQSGFSAKNKLDGISVMRDLSVELSELPALPETVRLIPSPILLNTVDTVLADVSRKVIKTAQFRTPIGTETNTPTQAGDADDEIPF